LNNDTEPTPGALSALVEKAESNPALAAVGSVLVYPDEPDKVQGWGGGRVDLWLGRSRHALTPMPDDWFHYITAASVLLSRLALERVGLFDERIFLYWEDADLCFRLREAGYRLGVAPHSVVMHKEHASTGRDRRIIDRHVTASGIYFLRKHAPIGWLSVSIFLSSRIVKWLVLGQFSRIGDIAAGIGDYIAGRRRADRGL
jgi:GT2 family glycosyltransferase